MKTIQIFKVLIFVAAIAWIIQPAAAQPGRAVMWEPVNIERRDLYNGPGGVAMRPNLRRVRFIQKEPGGTNPKYRIRDASGRVWVAKVANESQAEVAAHRLLYGVGYKTEINYLAPRLRIPGVGVFTNASLEARPENVDRQGRWNWNNNPFAGSRELQGLKIMMALINNWDIKEANNVILSRGGERQYVISDLGAAFGKMPMSSNVIFGWIGKNKNKPVDYVNTDFVKGTDRGFIDFAYKGKSAGLFDEITVEDGRWIANRLSRLSDRQIDDAFRAANYTPSQRRLLVREVRSRIRSLAGPSQIRAVR